MQDHVAAISFTLITIVAHQNLCVLVWLWLLLSSESCSLLIQLFWATIQSVFTHDEKHVQLRNTEYVERWDCYLFIAYIFFTWLNMRVIILVNNYIVVLSLAPLVEKHWPKGWSSSIAFMIDLLGIPALTDNVTKKTLVSHLFGSTVFADFYFI